MTKFDNDYQILTTTIKENRIVATKWVVANFASSIHGLNITSPVIRSTSEPEQTFLMTLVVPEHKEANVQLHLTFDNAAIGRKFYSRFEVSVNAKMIVDELRVFDANQANSQVFELDSFENIRKDMKVIEESDLIVLLRIYEIICQVGSEEVVKEADTCPTYTLPMLLDKQFGQYIDRHVLSVMKAESVEADPAIISVFNENPSQLFGLFRSKDARKMELAETLIRHSYWPYLKAFVSDGLVKVLGSVMYEASQVRTPDSIELKNAALRCVTALIEVAGDEKHLIVRDIDTVLFEEYPWLLFSL